MFERRSRQVRHCWNFAKARTMQRQNWASGIGTCWNVCWIQTCRESTSFDVVILGAGAAGLMAAIEAGRRGRRVAVLERAERPGKKILISGGGRCNFTNLHTRPDNFLLGQSPLCEIGAGALHSGGFYPAGGTARHRVSRKDAGPAFLRRIGAADCGPADERVRGRRRARASARRRCREVRAATDSSGAFTHCGRQRCLHCARR